MKNVDPKKERRAQIERVAVVIGSAIAVIASLRKLIQALAELRD